MQEDAGHGEVGVHLGVEREQGLAGAGHAGGVLEQAVAIGVVHGNGGGRVAEALADLLEGAAHRHAQLVVPDGVDAGLELGPERVAVFRRELDQRVHQAGLGGELFLGERDGLEELGGEAALEGIVAPLDAQHGALAGGLDRIAQRAVAEDGAEETAAAVAELEREVGVAVGGGLDLELLHHEHGGEGSAGVELG